MSDSPRRRRSRQAPPSATSMIVNFFLDSDLPMAKSMLDLAITLVARRSAYDEMSARLAVATVNKPKSIASAPPPQTMLVVPMPPALAQEAAPAPIAAVAAVPRPARVRRPPVAAPATAVDGDQPSQPRQRAKRSDAGQPRGARQRPSVTGSVATSAASAALPELPPQDVPFDAREIDVDLPLEG